MLKDDMRGRSRFHRPLHGAEPTEQLLPDQGCFDGPSLRSFLPPPFFEAHIVVPLHW